MPQSIKNALSKSEGNPSTKQAIQHKNRQGSCLPWGNAEHLSSVWSEQSSKGASPSAQTTVDFSTPDFIPKLKCKMK